MKIIPVEEFEKETLKTPVFQGTFWTWKTVKCDEIMLVVVLEVCDYSGKRRCSVCGHIGSRQAPNAVIRPVVGAIYDEYGNNIPPRSQLGKELKDQACNEHQIGQILCKKDLPFELLLLWEKEFLRNC